MENKIDISKILKDCPKGTKLYSPLCGECEFDHIEYMGKIVCQTKKYTTIWFLPTGVYFEGYSGAECVLFPSKENRDWSKFQRPFKDGDIVFYNDTIAIFKEWGDETLFRTYVTKYLCCDSLIDMNVPLFGKGVRKEVRFATKEEKEKLFQAIKDNGYCWNAETKTLKKLPKFKVGDRVRLKSKPNYRYTIYSLIWDDNNKLAYNLLPDNDKHLRLLTLNAQDDYELVPNKFDITTLKPLKSEVLVRDTAVGMWIPSFWGKYLKDSNCSYLTTNGCYKQCIPYKDNEHLLGTANDCNEYYKTW